MIYFKPNYTLTHARDALFEEYHILHSPTLCNRLFHRQERKLQRFLQKKGLRLAEEGTYANDTHTLIVTYTPCRDTQQPDFEHHIPGSTTYGFHIQLAAETDDPLTHKLKRFFSKYQHLTQIRAKRTWTHLDL